MTARLLVVDDEPQIRRFLRITLRTAGFEVDEAASGQKAIAACTGKPPDLMLLDLGLPDVDGIEVIQAVRTWSRLPIIVLSVRADERDKVAALDAGANDYIGKPFGTAELLARIRAALRARGDDPGRSAYEADGLTLDVARHEVTVDGRRVRLSPKEFELLHALLRHSGRVLTHAQLLREVWGEHHVEDVQYLRVYVGQLREKLGDDASAPRWIVNEPGVGYRLLDSDAKT